jgi:hypothetical protein
MAVIVPSELVDVLSACPDLSGAVRSIVADLSGVQLTLGNVLDLLPKLVKVAWSLNLPADKVQAQVLAAVNFLVDQYVPVEDHAVVQSVVDAAVPTVVVGLHTLVLDVEAVVARREKAVEQSAVGRWFAGLCGKVVAAVAGAPSTAASFVPAPVAPVAPVAAAPAPAPAPAAKEPEVVPVVAVAKEPEVVPVVAVAKEPEVVPVVADEAPVA